MSHIAHSASQVKSPKDTTVSVGTKIGTFLHTTCPFEKDLCILVVATTSVIEQGAIWNFVSMSRISEIFWTDLHWTSSPD